MKKTLEELRHQRSQKDFPFLNLEPEEYVELVIVRAKISLIFTWFMAISSAIIVTIFALVVSNIKPNDTLLPSFNVGPIFLLVLPCLYVLILLITIVATRVHNGNKLYVTNKRAIQTLRTGLFSHSTNIVELSRIEDVSFKQNGIIESIFHYGTIRMSTVGDETTYTFPYVDTPTDEIQTISHLIHQVRNEDKD